MCFINVVKQIIIKKYFTKISQIKHSVNTFFGSLQVCENQMFPRFVFNNDNTFVPECLVFAPPTVKYNEVVIHELQFRLINLATLFLDQYYFLNKTKRAKITTKRND